MMISFEKFAKIYDASKKRNWILFLACSRKGVSQLFLSEALNLAQTTISSHLIYLQDNGLIEKEKGQYFIKQKEYLFKKIKQDIVSAFNGKNYGRWSNVRIPAGFKPPLEPTKEVKKMVNDSLFEYFLQKTIDLTTKAPEYSITTYLCNIMWQLQEKYTTVEHTENGVKMYVNTDITKLPPTMKKGTIPFDSAVAGFISRNIRWFAIIYSNLPHETRVSKELMFL